MGLTTPTLFAVADLAVQPQADCRGMGGGKHWIPVSLTPLDLIARKSPLGHKRKSSVGLGMSVAGGKADVISAKADIQTTPDSHAYYSVRASLWLGRAASR